MEPFFDGGLFEIIIVLTIGCLLNYIFIKRYLLFIYSVAAIIVPVMLFFMKPGELQHWIISFCIVNSIFLVALLWKQALRKPGEPIINLTPLIEKLKKMKSNTGIKLTKPKNILSRQNKQ